MKSVSQGETWGAEHCLGNTTIPTKVATAFRKKWHKQDTETSTKV
jgi:hypothetical protein